MRLLDLFCCEGGAGTGYARAGFDVVGVDIAPQPRYPFEFHQADAIEFVREHGQEFDAIHASPPCQARTTMSSRWPEARAAHPNLIAPTREALKALGVPWVIENVTGARDEMPDAVMLHGGMFGLDIYRPRLFESSIALFTFKAKKPRTDFGIYGKQDGRRLFTRADGSVMYAASEEKARDLMGMPWASWDGLREAIPPAYAEFIGGQLMTYLMRDAA